MYNKVILVGNLTREIELRYTPSGVAVASTGMAINRRYTQNGEKKDEVCFVDITFFNRSAEIANQYLKKGSKILVDGRLKLDNWVDNSGAKRSKHSVVVESMQMLDSRGENSGMTTPDYGSNNYNTTTSSEQVSNRAESMAKTEDKKDIPTIDLNEDEIPF